MMQAETIVIFVIILILTIAAIKTILPNNAASKSCLLRYKAACSFTPISTAILVIAAVGVFLLARRFTLV